MMNLLHEKWERKGREGVERLPAQTRDVRWCQLLVYSEYIPTVCNSGGLCRGSRVHEACTIGFVPLCIVLGCGDGLGHVVCVS